MLSISFISITSKINKNIKKNNKYINQNNENYIVKNKLNNKDYTDEFLSKSNENIVFNKNKDYNWTLKIKESKKIKFEQNSNISINIISGGPILYKTFWTISSSWIIKDSSSLTLSWYIILDNIAWYTKFNLTSDKNIITPNTKYKIIKTIWNKEVIKTKWIIKNN